MVKHQMHTKITMGRVSPSKRLAEETVDAWGGDCFQSGFRPNKCLQQMLAPLQWATFSPALLRQVLVTRHGTSSPTQTIYVSLLEFVFPGNKEHPLLTGVSATVSRSCLTLPPFSNPKTCRNGLHSNRNHYRTRTPQPSLSYLHRHKH
jgi:hypothetical protein